MDIHVTALPFVSSQRFNVASVCGHFMDDTPSESSASADSQRQSAHRYPPRP
jgi:hypothetical protein